jgi:hypothetical protein
VEYFISVIGTVEVKNKRNNDATRRLKSLVGTKHRNWTSIILVAFLVMDCVCICFLTPSGFGENLDANGIDTF